MRFYVAKDVMLNTSCIQYQCSLSSPHIESQRVSTDWCCHLFNLSLTKTVGVALVFLISKADGTHYENGFIVNFFNEIQYFVFKMQKETFSEFQKSFD